jgi:hypothetical protein
LSIELPHEIRMSLPVTTGAVSSAGAEGDVVSGAELVAFTPELTFPFPKFPDIGVVTVITALLSEKFPAASMATTK